MKSQCCNGEVKLAEGIEGTNCWVCMTCGRPCEVDFYGYTTAFQKKVNDEWENSEYYKRPFVKPKRFDWKRFINWFNNIID
jgi:hypothetical protein